MKEKTVLTMLLVLAVAGCVTGGTVVNNNTGSNQSVNTTNNSSELVMVQNVIFEQALTGDYREVSRFREINFNFSLTEEQYSEAPNFTLIYYVDTISASGTNADLDDAELDFRMKAYGAPIVVPLTITDKTVNMGWNALPIPKNAFLPGSWNELNVHHPQYSFKISRFRLYYPTRIPRSQAEQQGLRTEKF